LTFSGVSRRFSGFPISLKSATFFSGGSAGGAMRAASSMSSPNPSLFAPVESTIAPFSARHVPASTFQRRAAASGQHHARSGRGLAQR
jgi:hypothetical protein